VVTPGLMSADALPILTVVVGDRAAASSKSLSSSVIDSSEERARAFRAERFTLVVITKVARQGSELAAGQLTVSSAPLPRSSRKMPRGS
jgi:hypothetical protein